MPSFVLVHSPLVGPTTWKWVAEELEQRGHHVVVPVVPEAVTAKGWQAFVEAVADQAGRGEGAVLVGHSGAGPLLPQIAARARRPLGPLVFVDAGIPPVAGEVELMPTEFLVELRAMACDGKLPRWSEWFGPGVMEELVPDDDRRAAICAELPQVPVTYFEERPPVPTGWSMAACGYLQLSEPYAADAAEASCRGWPVVDLPGAHLDIVVHPDATAEAILSLVVRLASRP